MEPGRSKFCGLLPGEKEVMQLLASVAELLFKINRLTPVRAGAAAPRGNRLSAPCALLLKVRAAALCLFPSLLPASSPAGPGGGRTALEKTENNGTSSPVVLGEQQFAARRFATKR